MKPRETKTITFKTDDFDIQLDPHSPMSACGSDFSDPVGTCEHVIKYKGDIINRIYHIAPYDTNVILKSERFDKDDIQTCIDKIFTQHALNAVTIHDHQSYLDSDSWFMIPVLIYRKYFRERYLYGPPPEEWLDILSSTVFIADRYESISLAGIYYSFSKWNAIFNPKKSIPTYSEILNDTVDETERQWSYIFGPYEKRRDQAAEIVSEWGIPTI